MTAAEIVIGIAGLMIGILIGIRISPVREYLDLRPCEKCGNRWPGVILLSGYRVECQVCDDEKTDNYNTPEDAVRAWNRKWHRDNRR